MLESIDSPQGDQVARSAATTAIGSPRATAITVTDISVLVLMRVVQVLVLVVLDEPVMLDVVGGRVRGLVQAGMARPHPGSDQLGIHAGQRISLAAAQRVAHE
jgi:hypothetical protein